MQSGAGVRECGGGVEAKDTGGETSRFAQFTDPANWLSGHGSRIEALRDDDRENVIRLELVIRREGVEVMNGNNMCGNGDQGGIRVTKLVYPDKSVAFEIAGRSAAVSSRQELEAFLSRVVEETMDTFRFRKEAKPLDSGSEAGMTGKGEF